MMRVRYLSAVFLALVSCQKPLSPEQPQPAPAAAREERMDIPEFRDEVYGDPEFSKTPRIQFMWRLPGEERNTIWSIKLDGTDLQRTVKAEVLYSGESREARDAMRSPDGRYIACVGSTEDDLLRFVVDLKEKKVRTMMKAGNRPHFNWTPDSRYVIFYGDMKLWQYDVTNGRLSELPMIYSAGLYLVDNGKRFIAIRDQAIEHYDRAGKLLKSIPLPFETGQYQTASPDGRTFLFNVGTESIVLRSDKPNSPLWRDNKFRPRAVFGPDGKILYYFDFFDLVALDVVTGKETKIARLVERVPEDPTLMNVRSTQ